MFEILGLINKFIPDASKAKELEASIKGSYEKTFQKALESETQIRLVEMKQKGIVSKWRPLAAIAIFLCLFLYWFIYPLTMIIIGLFDLNVYLPQLPELPIEFYGLATAFVSIYAFGRSIEKRG